MQRPSNPINGAAASPLGNLEHSQFLAFEQVSKYVVGANIAGFVKMVNAMIDRGLVKNSNALIAVKVIQASPPPAENWCIIHVDQRHHYEWFSFCFA